MKEAHNEGDQDLRRNTPVLLFEHQTKGVLASNILEISDDVLVISSDDVANDISHLTLLDLLTGVKLSFRSTVSGTK